MQKLKSLRGAIGSYGRVAAGGIVDVSESEAEKLLKTKRFVRASDADIKAAQERQQAELAVETAGAVPGFSAMPAKPETTDRLSHLVQTGQIDRDKARELASLQISLSTEEVQGFINAEAKRAFAEIAAAQAELDQRERLLAEKSEELARREADLGARGSALPDASAVAPEGGRDQAKAEKSSDDASKVSAKEKTAK